MLSEAINSTIGDDVITIEWSVFNNGGGRIEQFLVDWIIPGASQYTRVPEGTVESDATYLQISLGRVLAGRNYQYRIQAVNSGGFVSEYVFYELRSSKGMLYCYALCMYAPPITIYIDYPIITYLQIFQWYRHKYTLIFGSSIEAILHSVWKTQQ